MANIQSPVAVVAEAARSAAMFSGKNFCEEGKKTHAHTCHNLTHAFKPPAMYVKRDKIKLQEEGEKKTFWIIRSNKQFWVNLSAYTEKETVIFQY